MARPRVVELCAGAGGQALGLELAGFDHALAIELDRQAAETLRANRQSWDVRIGDVADSDVWVPADYVGVDLLAGGVPCPPFSIAGKQLGATDERDLFAWAVELVATVQPRALLLENVRGLSAPRFAAYRQHVRDRLAGLGYWSDWRLLHAAAFGVPQLRPRFVLVALRSEIASAFEWPLPVPSALTVGETLYPLMAADGWLGASTWAEKANDIAPTIVGGSKKHGGADLGPTRAKRAWATMGVDALGVADQPPSATTPIDFMPKLTCEMVALLQGWKPGGDYDWTFTGRKTSKYRQIGNAFPPPVARAVGRAIHDALVARSEQPPAGLTDDEVIHDSLYRALRTADRHSTLSELKLALEESDDAEVLRRMEYLGRDFTIDERDQDGERAFLLKGFKGFVGQEDHVRHEKFRELRATVS